MKNSTSVWIENKTFDLIYIISPAFIVSFVVVLCYLLGFAPKEVSSELWLIVVVFIDVAHVWSTLFRTYLSKEGVKTNRNLLIFTPVCCYLIGVILHSVGSLLFWRFLAYMAVFHFVRQQYGFFKIYQKKSIVPIFDKLAIYSASLIPLLIWHFSGQQEMNWFIKGDFFYFKTDLLALLLKYIGVLIPIVYLLKEKVYSKNSLLAPHNLIYIGTVFSWGIGIVWIGTDWAFTLTNVISHGIPYFALIYAANMKERKQLLWPKILPVFSGFFLVFLIAYIEEAAWANFIWRENLEFFSWVGSESALENTSLIALVVPLLALPQFTHYVLDGFIWRKELPHVEAAHH